MELNIKDFDELEQYFKRKAQHVEELTKEELEFLKHIQSKVNETSTYGCMPTIEISEYIEED